MATIKKGQSFESRTGAVYTVKSVDPRGFIIIRNSSGKDVRISSKLIESTRDKIEAGQSLNFQANGPKGGISYTVAIEAGVVHALRDIIRADVDARLWVAK